MEAHYIIRNVSPEAAKISSYRRGDYLTDVHAKLREDAERLAEMFTDHAAIAGIVYRVETFDDSVDITTFYHLR